MKERMAVLSVCLDQDALRAVRILASEEKYRSLGDFVREAVDLHIKKILARKEKSRLEGKIPSTRHVV